MTANRNEKRDARKIVEHLNVSYTTALRMLRKQVYVVRGNQVEEGPNYEPN